MWDNTTTLKTELSFLGIHNVRDGAPYSWFLPIYVNLAQSGIRFDLEEANIWITNGVVDASKDVKLVHALEAAVPGSVISFEGANEYEYNYYTYNGLSSYGQLDVFGIADDWSTPDFESRV